IGAVERKPQFRAVEKDGGPAEWEAGQTVARAGLIFRKRPQGIAAAAQETFRQGDRIRRIGIRRYRKRWLNAKLRFSGKYDLWSQPVVGGVSRQQANETGLRGKNFGGDSGFERRVDAFVGVDGIVAPVLYEVVGDDSDAHRLRQLRQQQRIDPQIGNAHVPI